MRNRIKHFLLFICFLCHFIASSQQDNIVKDYYKEDFTVRAFGYSKLHYFARLSYNNQTIYTTNILHPHKSIIIVSSKNNGVKTLDFSNDENFLITGTNTGNIEIWDLNKRILFKKISIHEKAINKVKTISGESSFISAGNDGSIFLVDFQESEKFKILGKHQGIVRDFDVSNDNNFLVSIGSDKKLMLWDLKENKKTKFIDNVYENLSSVKFASQNNNILLGNTDGMLFWLDSELNLIKKTKVHDNIITSICRVSENTFVTGSFDGSIKKINLLDFTAKELYSGKSYIINMVIKNNKLTFSKQNGELMSIKLNHK